MRRKRVRETVPVLLTICLAGCGATRSTPSRQSSADPIHSAANVAALPSPVDAATTERARASAPLPAPPVALREPAVRQWLIPYRAKRKREMAAYSLRHYGERTYLLTDPKVVVEHYTETATAREAFNTFAPDTPDSEFHELPNTCAHFLVEPSGTIDQLVPLAVRCRHTTGLNWTSIGVENIGFSDGEILHDHRQLAASLRLTRWLRCRYRIALKDVIGHNESLSSPFHHDLVPAFQHQTHSDWQHADMVHYRALLAGMPCPRG